MDWDGRNFTEAEIAAAEPEQFPEFLRMEGRVTLVYGAERLEVGDELSYALQELGTVALQLLTDGQAVFAGYANEQEYTFIRSGDMLEIICAYRGEKINGITVPADDSLAALFDVGQRWCALLSRLASDNLTPLEIEYICQSFEDKTEEFRAHQASHMVKSATKC